MYERIVINENTEYGENKKSHMGLGLPPKNLVIHNASSDHISILATDAINGNAVQLTIRKADIPDWIVSKE